MDKKMTAIEFAKYRLERAKQDLSDAEFNYNKSNLIKIKKAS